jgi:hypothetical protein
MHADCSIGLKVMELLLFLLFDQMQYNGPNVDNYTYPVSENNPNKTQVVSRNKTT